jgi:transcription antitermination factor NusA-like protein
MLLTGLSLTAGTPVQAVRDKPVNNIKIRNIKWPNLIERFIEKGISPADCINLYQELTVVFYR